MFSWIFPPKGDRSSWKLPSSHIWRGLEQDSKWCKRAKNLDRLFLFLYAVILLVYKLPVVTKIIMGTIISIHLYEKQQIYQ